MANSFAQTLAGGTQDLAALAGLFCTDGVERNALSVQSGYFGIAASSLSLLGILGLVRSAIKVALGLRRCSNAGFNLDSLRGLYGYLLEESEEQKNRIECDYTEVAFGKTKSVKNGKVAIDTHIGNDKYDHVVIRRKKRFFDPQLTPIVNVGSDWPEKLYSKTVVNLGNLQREKSVSQSPILIGLLLFLCPGMTAWLLLVVSTTWNGVLLFATLGLHISLPLLISVPIWHGRNMSQPGAHMSVNAWNILTGGKYESQPEEKKRLNKLSFLHARVADGDVLHISGDRKLLDSERMQGLVLLPAIVCAIAYVCQYAVLTKASNRQSLIWVGCQAVLALVRLLFWILDPQFDNPEGMQTEYAIFNNTQFQQFTLMEMACACSESPSGTIIPRWAWEYLLETDITRLLEAAIPDDPPLSPEKGLKFLILLDIDFDRIVRRRRGRLEPENIYGNFWRLGLEMLEDQTIQPFILIEPELLLKASTQNGPSILNPCNLHVFNQQGDRIHLQPIGGKCPDNCSFLIGPNAENKSSALEDKDSWRYLLDRSRKVRNLFKDHFFDKIPWQSVNTWGDALWTVATPGITDRRDNVHPAHATTTRTWGNGNNGNMTGAIEFVQEYIKDGVQSASVKKRGNGRGGNKTEVIENV
ncbi:hypothetical protein A1F94_001347 [Pyrenophora tritici-repentis]|nr:hypothetical protein PtrV1_01968 [Pyrenophora tritici-repentis]KAG9388455.1 hypothetical protein A1F94_001347 [Pyrenophora tritici-repentis]